VGVAAAGGRRAPAMCSQSWLVVITCTYPVLKVLVLNKVLAVYHLHLLEGADVPVQGGQLEWMMMSGVQCASAREGVVLTGLRRGNRAPN